MRIGDLLLERRVVRQSELALALEEQALSEGRRLCSLLISRGAIEFDDAARALGDHRGVPCALAKHLQHRDPKLAGLIPAELGRMSCALPIGKTSGGALIVCVRDPAPALLATLQRTTRTEVLMVITPATRLELLIAASYGADPSDEFDVDLASAVGLPPAPPPEPQRMRPAPPAMPPPPDVDMLDPDSVRLALSDLDDIRVAKDFSQSGIIIPPNMSSSSAAGRITNQRATLPKLAPSIEMTREQLELTDTRDHATDLAMAFVAGRWRSGIVMVVRESTAIGYRSHGLDASGDIANIALSLEQPSTIERAIQTARPSQQLPVTSAQTELSRLLGKPTQIIAAPVAVAGRVVAVVAVGDSIHGAADSEAPTALAGLAGVRARSHALAERIRRS